MCDENNINLGNRNYILDTICKIDRMQKEALVDNETTCITCEKSLALASYNTLPISFVLKCGNTFESFVGVSDATTNFYRIESIREGRFVTLRLLSNTAGVLSPTAYTTTLDTSCICAIQCFDPINVESCNLI